METDPSKITYTDGIQDQWLVHPAFLSEASIGGGFGSKSGNNDGITGIWVAKDVGTMYKLSYNMNRNADSHMLKNSEWGAIAYLAHSKYGRNGTEITINDVKYASKDPSYSKLDIYTGGSDTETGYLNNGIQSTTGNVYGIYDINGGKWEFVSAYLEDATNSDLIRYGGELYTTTEMKYKNIYTKSSSGNGVDNYTLSETKKGDAIYETSANVTSYNSWFGDDSGFPASYAFFLRGGASSGSGSGVFCFQATFGYGNAGALGFRSCLVVD